MNTKKMSMSVGAFVTGAAMIASFAVAVPAFAQTGNGAAAQNQPARIIARSDTAITARITALNALATRVANAKNVDATTKANISSSIQTNISGLTTLKAKIDGETDATTLKADEKLITGSFRIYALIIPQGWIVASADRVTTVAGLLTTISGKIETRITTAQTAGHDVTALRTALADLNAKVTDAKNQSAAAVAGISGLTPDQGNQTLMQSNTAALKAARADIKTASQDFKAAREDAKTIIAALKGFHTPATTGSTH
jgi:hypothetical protein